MSGCGSSMVSILNNDDHPSFAIRSNARLGRSCTSPTFYPRHSEQQLAPINYYQHSLTHVSSESPTASARRTRTRPFAAMTESVQPISPGSSDDSAYDYPTSQPSSSPAYHPHSRPGARREPYHYPSRGFAAPRTPPEMRSGTANEAKATSPTDTRGARKNKYPCPYSASHGCSATFTTSGHAARHGKKHTGEKSVHCPVCDKAFTRKDNMKQHIRTHRTHSDDTRCTSRAEGEVRWEGLARF